MDRIRIASRLVKIAKDLLAFWDLTLYAPSKQDINLATAMVHGALQAEDADMKTAKVDFRRYLVYQENAETNPDSGRNSNKYLVITVMVDPRTGKFGAGCAGGRIGNKPRLYQNWGVADDVKILQRQFESYIDKKTRGQRDHYVEVSEKDL